MFLREETVKNEEPEILMEITMKNLLSSGELDLRDFLNRVDMLRTIGRTVLISKYGEYYRLVNYLTRYTDRMIGCRSACRRWWRFSRSSITATWRAESWRGGKALQKRGEALRLSLHRPERRTGHGG